LQWATATDNIGVALYEVYADGALAGTTETTGWTFSGLTPLTNYSVTVRAVDLAGNKSPASVALTVKTAEPPDTTPPSVPSGLTASDILGTSFKLSWTASTDNMAVSAYEVYLNGTLTQTVSGSAGVVPSITVTLTGLELSKTYAVTVRAVDAAGNQSADSTALNVTTARTNIVPDTTAPSVPTGLSSANVTSTGFTLKWTISTDNVGVTGYEVYRNGTLLATVTGTVGGTPATTYAVTGLTASTTYSMTVRAVDAAGNKSAASTTLNVTTSAAGTDTTTPSVPTGLNSSNITTTGFRVAWTAATDNVGVVGYNVYRNGVYVTTVGGTSYTFTGLAANTSYNITVLALDAAKNRSAQSAALAVKTLAP
jgi:chitodextrinase